MKTTRRSSVKHTIFFDDKCSLCWRSVNRIYAWDRKKSFQFIPLRDRSTKHVLKQRWHKLKNANTLVLVENVHTPHAKIWTRGRAVARILWLLGGWKKIPGVLAYVPFGIDALYMLIARYRHRF